MRYLEICVCRKNKGVAVQVPESERNFKQLRVKKVVGLSLFCESWVLKSGELEKRILPVTLYCDFSQINLMLLPSLSFYFKSVLHSCVKALKLTSKVKVMICLIMY